MENKSALAYHQTSQGGGYTTKKNEKIIEIEKEQRDLKIKYIENQLKPILIGIILFTILFCCIYFISTNETFFRQILVFGVAIVGIVLAYIFILEEYFFMNSFFQLEIKYYIWKLEQNSLKKQTASFSFQIFFNSFQNELLSHVTGFRRYNTLFRKDIFNFRIIKVKKEIDIFFNLIIDLILKKEFNKQIGITTILEPECDLEDFLNKFKDVFIKHPGSLNLVALDNFFKILNTHIKTKYEEPYSEIENEVDKYYINHEKLIERRAERKSELIRSTEAFLFAFLVAFITAKILM